MEAESTSSHLQNHRHTLPRKQIPQIQQKSPKHLTQTKKFNFDSEIPVVPVEQCFHRWLVRKGTGESFRLFCKECCVTLIKGSDSPWLEPGSEECRHDRLYAKGSNQHGLRLRCLKCKSLIWTNNAASQVWLHRSNTLTILGRDRITRSLFEFTAEIADPPSGPEDNDDPPEVINNPGQRK